MPANALEFLERENTKKVRLLEQNHDVSGFIHAVLDHCVEYCNRHGCRMEDLVIDRPYVEGFGSGLGEYLRARIYHR